MGVAILIALSVCAIGYAMLRAAGLTKGISTIGLAPAIGLATCTIWSTWLASLRAPPAVAGCGLGLLTLSGAVLAWREREAVRSVLATRPLWLAWLGAGVLVSLVATGTGFASQQVPLSTHDGAFHVETIHALRGGQAIPGWYPPGLAASFSAWLQMLPWLDSASGSYDLGLSLALLTPIAVFGLGVVVLADLRMGGLAALLAALTYLLGYFGQLWSGWPLQVGLILTLGVWSLALEYVNRPDARRPVLAGLLLGGLILTHGTELYTTAIILLTVAVANARAIRWTGLPRHLALAGGVAIVVAAPYLPTLFQWAGGGGAFSVGFEHGGTLELDARGSLAAESLLLFGLYALGIDAPVRLLLLACGIRLLVRERRALNVVWLAVVFGALALAFALLNGLPLLRQLYAATYPWGAPYRQLTLVSIMGVLIAARGATGLADAFMNWSARLARTRFRQRVRRLGQLVPFTWVVLSTWALAVFLSVAIQVVSSYSPDDDAAMGWLRANAEPGAVVVNDTFADAGIWAPYKAHTPVLITRVGAGGADEAARELIVANVAHLDQVPSAAAAACALHVRYTYYGAKQTAWQKRTFPARAEMQASPALEEVFRSGQASVFRVRSNCQPMN